MGPKKEKKEMKYDGKLAIADPLPINPWQAWRAVRLAGGSYRR